MIVTEEMKIAELQVFYSPEEFLKTLQGNEKFSNIDSRKSKFQTKISVEFLIENIITRCEVKIGRKVGSKKNAAPCEIIVNGIEVSNLAIGFGEKVDVSNNDAFPWEVTEVFSMPPLVSFTWRHWIFEEDLEVDGFAIATVGENLQVEKIEVFYSSDETVRKYVGDMKKCPFSSIH